MSCPADPLQQAWQSQPAPAPRATPDELLHAARLGRQAALYTDVVVISVLSAVGLGMLGWALHDFHRNWPWLIYSASDVWVVTFMLVNRWRRRRRAPRFDAPLIAHVEWSIRDIEHRMTLDRRSFWWYILPIALGCIIPATIVFPLNAPNSPAWQVALALLLTLGLFGAVFAFVHLSMKRGQRKSHALRRQELQALRALRESLLKLDE